MKQYHYLILIFLHIACSKDDTTIIPEPEKKVEQNLPPEHFTVEVSEIAYNAATLNWTQPNDPEDDSVNFSIYLKSELVQEDISDLAFRLTNLNELTDYTGTVVATDNYGNKATEEFSFSTNKNYQKYLKKYNYSDSEYGIGGSPYSVIKTAHNNYIIVGASNFNGDGFQFFVLKLDENGDKIWQKFYPYQVGDAWNFKIIRSKDGYVFAGHHHVLKIDEDGNQLWYKKIQSYDMEDTSAEIKSLVEDTSGEIYLVGGRGNPDSFKKQLGVVTKISQDGEIIWEKVFDDTYRGFFDDVVLDDNHLIIFGSKEVSGVTPEEEYMEGSSAENIDFWVLKLDLNGTLVWQKTYDDGGGYAFPRRILISRDNNYFLAGFSWGAYDIGSGKILKIDTSGNLIFEISSDLSAINDIYETHDGGLIATGKVDFASSSGLGLSKFDKQGNLEWNQIYQETFTYLSGHGVLQLEDGGYFIVGGSAKNYYYDNDRPQILIYKTDPDGNYQ